MKIEAYANPKVLHWARRMAGLEVEDAARKAQVKADRIESWEAGERRPTITQLRKLADIYKRPLAVFFFEKSPPDEPIPQDFRRFDPDAAELLSPELRLAIRVARTRRESALELFEELDEEPPRFALAARLSEDPEKVGVRVRDALCRGSPPRSADPRVAFNFWRGAAERLGALVFQAEKIDVEEMRGLSLSERPLPTIVLNIKDAYAGRSFSLLHELVHIMLKRGGLCVFEESGPRTEIQRTEVFCNHVAGAALVPAVSLLQEPETPRRKVSSIPDDAVRAIARRYGTSSEAVLRRLVILDRVSRDFYQRKRDEYIKQYEELRVEKRKSGGYPSRSALAVARGGRLFTRLVLEAYDEERITASDVAELVGERLKHLDKIRGAIARMATTSGEPS